MSVFGIILAVIGGIYTLGIIALIVRITPLVIFDGKWYKAYYLVISYNHWVRTVLNKPELTIYPCECIVNLEQTSVWKTMFCSFWDFYTDIDVLHSLRRYYNSSDYIDIKEFMRYKKGGSQNENG
jgi:hypothetical protein